MPKKYPQVFTNEWVYPKMRGYNFACCDCGLVHTMDFDIAVVADIVKDGKIIGGKKLVAVVPIVATEKELNLIVRMRAKRNNRRTAQLRRHKRKKND